MNKMWAGRFREELNAEADDFNSSISFDKRLFKQDIKGSIAHATMLGAQKIIPEKECSLIIATLKVILSDIESGLLSIDENAEDIHMFIESELTRRIGDAGKMLHTARSRNDQVALDIRLYLRDESEEIISLIKEAIASLLSKAKENIASIMPGYTHLQRAQPVSFAHYLLAYVMMLKRDISRIEDAKDRMNYSPLGSCALAGTTYNTDRFMTAKLLNMNGICENSLDGVSDRDFCIELANAFSILSMHMSRLCEEIIMWCSFEFKFIELSDSFSTGSSIMPQKKNPDMAELIRGKTARVYGNQITLLTLMKGLPLAYNKDMQEDKEAIFDSVDTVKMCLSVLSPMIDTMKVNKENMRKAASGGFINATDCADYLVKKGMPFRSAYKITGEIVAECIEKNTVLEELPIEAYKKHSELFSEDLYTDINLEKCMQKRTSEGGTSESSVQKQIKYIEEYLAK